MTVAPGTNQPHPHDDDLPVGRVLGRREALRFLGLTGLSGLVLVACGSDGTDTASSGATTGTGGSTATSSGSTVEAATSDVAVDCVVRPEMTEGPYFVDVALDRSDIRSGADGTTVDGTDLELTLAVMAVSDGSCSPIEGALVDIWHCDAEGDYSGVSGDSSDFLRGQQTTDTTGAATFTTILPGWYSGRTVHIHLKVRTQGGDGNTYELTSQLFFGDDFTAGYLAQGAYATKGQSDTSNAADSIYSGGGDQMTLSPSPSGDGYAATFTIGLDLSDTAVAASDAASGGGGGGGGGGGAGGPGGGGPGNG